MPLFIAPTEYEEGIAHHLKEKYPESTWKKELVTFENARKLVLDTCSDAAERQPAVKLLSFFHATLASIWLGIELRVYDGFSELSGADPKTTKFLFHGSDRRTHWILLTPS